MKTKITMVMAITLMVVVYLRYGRRFYRDLMFCIQQDYPEATSYWRFVRITFHEGVMESIHEEFPDATSFRDYLRLMWQHEMGKDVGYTTFESTVITLVCMVLVTIGVLAINSSLWPFLFTGFALLPIVLFMVWLIVRIYIWTNNWAERKIQNFLYTTRVNEDGSSWGYFDQEGNFTMTRRNK